MFFKHDVVGDLGGGAFDGMNPTPFGIHANMGPHADVSLVAFLGLRYLGIALLVLVLGGTRRSDQRSINYRATFHAQVFLIKSALTSAKMMSASSCCQGLCTQIA